MQARSTSSAVLLCVLLVAVSIAALFAGLSATSLQARNDVEQQLAASSRASSASAISAEVQSQDSGNRRPPARGVVIGPESARRRIQSQPRVVREPQVLVRLARDVPIRTSPGRGRMIGVMPARSMYIKDPMTVWVRKISPDRRWGYVRVPWSARVQHGWISLAGLKVVITRTVVIASLRDRRVRVWQRGRKVVDVPAAIGGSASPTPRGEFFITDQVAITPASPSFGSHAFGISAIQPRTPPGWTGGNQMAIHGTGDPSSIGRAVSAGCLRVSERALSRLRPLLEPGTPVIIQL